MLVTLTPAVQFRFLLLLPPFGSHWYATGAGSVIRMISFLLSWSAGYRSAFQYHMPFRGEKIPLLLIKQIIVDVLQGPEVCAASDTSASVSC